MPKFRSKPVEIEAIQLTAQRMSDIDDGLELRPKGLFHLLNGVWWCLTRQGGVSAHEGDWIIRELDGAGCYPCHPDVFADKYEPVD